MTKQLSIRIMIVLSLLSSLLIAFQNCSQKLSVQDVGNGSSEQLSTAPGVKYELPEVQVISTTTSYNRRNFEIPFSIKIDPSLELKSVECSIQNHADLNCLSDRISIRNLLDGQHTLRLRIKDSQNQLSQEVSFSFNLDATPPSITVLSQPTGYKKDRFAEFLFRVIDEKSHVQKVECSLNNGTFSNCTSFSNHILAELTDQRHTLKIRATDLLGNATELTSQNWWVDSVAPTLTIANRPPSITNISQQSLEFNASDSSGGLIQFLCQFNSMTATTCTSPFTVNATNDGLQTLRITATDEAGNSTNQTIQWTLDRIKPIVTLTANPGTRSALQTFRFEFNATDTLSGITSVKCSLNGATFNDCNSVSYHTVNLSGQGRMTFSVRAYDGASNMSLEATHIWDVDLSAPSINIVARPAPMVRIQAANFELSFSDSGNTNLTNRCQHNSNTTFTCTNSFTITAVEGENRLKISSTDDQNNRSEVTVVWYLDSQSPVMSYLRSSSPTITNINQFALEFAATDANLITFECSVMNANLPVRVISNCVSGTLISNLVQGGVSISVRAIDQAGNFSPPLTLNRTVDLVAPVVSNLTFSEQSPTKIEALSATFTGTDSGSGIEQYRCKLTKPLLAPIESVCSSSFQISNFTEGDLILEVWAVDQAGNRSISQIKNILIDRTQPSKPMLNLAGPNLRIDRNLTFSFSSNDSNGSPTFFCQIIGLDANELPCTSPYSRLLSFDGTFELKVKAKDLAGNMSEANAVSFTVDTTSPELPNISSSSSSPTQNQSVTFSFSSVDIVSGISHYVCEFNGMTISPCVSPKDFSLVSGSNLLKVKAVNRVGLESAFKEYELSFVQECTIGYKPIKLTVFETVPVDYKIPIECLNSGVSSAGALVSGISNWSTQTLEGLNLNLGTGSIVGTPSKTTDMTQLKSRLFYGLHDPYYVNFRIGTGLTKTLELKIRVLPAHCSGLTGEGTSSLPFKIRNKNDFFCMNSFFNESAFWSLETDLDLRIEDYPSRFFELSIPFNKLSLVQRFAGNFNGNNRQIIYTLDCNLSNCNNSNSGSGNSISLFLDAQNPTFKNLKTKIFFKAVQSNTTYFQSVAGLFVGIAGSENRGAVIQKVKTELQVENAHNIQNIAGLAVSLNYNLAYPAEIFETSATALVLNSKPQNLFGLIGSGANVHVKDSVAAMTLDLPSSHTISRLGLRSFDSTYASTVNHVFRLENSYLKVSMLSQSISCEFAPFGGYNVGPPSYTLTANTTYSNSFWVGDLRYPSHCNPLNIMGPVKLLPSEYPSTMIRFNLNPLIWKAGADGLPALIWIDQ